LQKRAVDCERRVATQTTPCASEADETGAGDERHDQGAVVEGNIVPTRRPRQEFLLASMGRIQRLCRWPRKADGMGEAASQNGGCNILSLLRICAVAGRAAKSAGGPSWKIAITSTPPPHPGGEGAGRRFRTQCGNAARRGLCYVARRTQHQEMKDATCCAARERLLATC
jgi:hypothetical protein